MTHQEEAERAHSFQEQGFHGYKIHSATPWMHDDGFDQTVATAAAVIAAVGPDFPVMVDVNNAYYEHTAIAVGRELESSGSGTSRSRSPRTTTTRTPGWRMRSTSQSRPASRSTRAGSSGT